MSVYNRKELTGPASSSEKKVVEVSGERSGRSVAPVVPQSCSGPKSWVCFWVFWGFFRRVSGASARFFLMSLFLVAFRTGLA